MTTWAAKSLDSVQGYSLPLKSTMSQFGNDGSVGFTWDFEVNKIKFNKTYPDSTFRPVLQPGVTVLNGVTNKSYQTPGVAAATAVPPGTHVAIQATQPRDWTTTLSAGGVALGAALVIAGSVAMWRRR